ncbi:hypothetical protein HAX54_020061, partial [Datura stramonium]|nr:hypothetical protein [Datura stramonium]
MPIAGRPMIEDFEFRFQSRRDLLWRGLTEQRAEAKSACESSVRVQVVRQRRSGRLASSSEGGKLPTGVPAPGGRPGEGESRRRQGTNGTRTKEVRKRLAEL